MTVRQLIEEPSLSGWQVCFPRHFFFCKYYMYGVDGMCGVCVGVCVGSVCVGVGGRELL